MALPTSITGISTAMAPVGPFVVSSVAETEAILVAAPRAGTGGVGVGLATSSGFCGSFTPTKDMAVASFDIMACKTGAPPDAFYADLYACASGIPTGNSLGRSDNILPGALTANVLTSQPLVFPTTPRLTAGVQYVLWFHRTGSLDSANGFQVGFSDTDVPNEGYAIQNNLGQWQAGRYTNDISLTINAVTRFNYALYFFGRHSSSTTMLRAYKATDPEGAWAECDVETFSLDIGNVAGYQVGSIIHLVVGQSTTVVSPVGQMTYIQFDTATDTFSGIETLSTQVNTAGQTGAQQSGCSVVVRSNGEVVAFYSAAQTATMGSPYARVYYRRRTAPATWTAPVEVDPATAFDARNPECVLDASGRVHLFFYLGTSSLTTRTLSASNILNTTASIPSSATALAVGATAYLDVSTSRLVAVSAAAATTLTVHKADGADTPTWSTSGTNFSLNGFPFALFNDNGVPYLLHRWNNDGDLYVRSSLDDGLNWSATQVSAFVGTVPAAATALSVDGNVYLRDNRYVIPYVVNDSGTWKYNEYTVRYASLADAWDMNSRYPAGATYITLYDNDKRVVLAGSGGIRSTTGRMNQAAGKYYAEFYYDGSCYALGLVPASGNVAQPSTTGLSIREDGTIWYASTQIGNIGSTIGFGDTVGLAWDALNERAWFRKNAGFWNGSATANPATGSEGLVINTYTGTENQYLWVASGGSTNITVRTEIADLAFVGPSGFASWMNEKFTVADAWSAADQNNGVLSNSDRTLTYSVGGQARSTKRIAANDGGKYYCETVWGATFGQNGGNRVGIHDVSVPITTGLFGIGGHFAISLGVNGIYLNQNVISSGVTLSAGCVASFAFDTVNLRGWVRKDSGYWNNNASADPATNVGGMDLSTFAGKTFAVATTLVVDGDAATVRTRKDQFTQTTPAGFLSFMGETLVIPDMGTLASGAASVSGAGFATHHGTGVLQAVNAFLVNPGGISGSTGTGALTALWTAPVSANTILNSEEFDNAAWSKTNATVTANAVTAPNSTLTADQIFDDAVASGGHAVAMSRPTVAGQPHTLSVYAKAGTRGFIRLSLSGGTYYSVFDLNAGTLGLTSGLTSRNIEAVGGGWYRCSITITIAGASVTNTIALMPANQVNPNYAGDGSSLYLWGVQLEQASAASSYTKPVGNEISPLTGVGTASWNATGALVANDPPRWNWQVRSQELDHAGWTKSNTTIAPNAATAPNGTLTADEVFDNPTNGSHIISQFSQGTHLNKRLVYSIFAKANTLTWLQLLHNSAPGVSANFNLANGTVGATTGVDGTAEIRAVGGGWYRCSLSVVTTVTTPDLYFILKNANDPGLQAYPGTGQSLYLWGAQLESDTATTSPAGYIPTTNAPLSISEGSRLSAVGEVTTPPAIGVGALTTGVAALSAFGSVRSTGTGALDAAKVGLVIGRAAPFSTPFGTSESYASVAQGFNALGTDLSAIVTSVSKAGTQTDAVVAKVWMNGGSSRPSAPQLGVTSTPVDSSAIVLDTLTPVVFTFSPPVKLTAGVAYVVSFERTGALVTDANLYRIATDNDTYPDGSVSRSDGAGGNWSPNTLYDFTATIEFATGCKVVGAGVSQVVATGALVQTKPTATGAGFSGATSTSTLLQATMPPIFLGSGISGTYGGVGTLAAGYFVNPLIGSGTASWAGTAVFSAQVAAVVGAGNASWRATGALVVTTPAALVGVGVSRWTGSGTMPAQIAALAGVGVSGTTLGSGTLTSGLSKVTALGSAVTGIGGTGELIPQPPVLSPIDAGALVHIDFVANAGFVKGTGSVGIETLVGNDPAITGVDTGYNPAWITQYGYDVYANDGTVVPAFLGALLAGIVGGGSVIIKFQARPDASVGWDTEAFDLTILNTTGSSRNIWLMSDWTYLGAGSYLSMDQLEDIWILSPDVVINAVGFTVRPSISFEWAGNDRGVLSFPLTNNDTPPLYPMSASYMDPLGPIASITVFDRLSTADLKAQTLPTLYPLESTKAMSGAGISGTYGGTGVLTSTATVAGAGIVLATGSGVLVVPGVAALAGVGGVASVGTAALNVQAAVAVGAGIARHVATGTLPSTYATLAGAGVIIAAPEGTGTFVAQSAVVVGTANVRWIATGALADQAATITSTGAVRWSGTGAMPAGVAAVDGAGVSSSSVTAANLIASRATVMGFEGVVTVEGTGSMQAQSHALAAAGGVLTSGTGVLIDAAPALAGAGLTRSLGTGAPISQASVISGAGVSSVAGVGAIIPTTAAVISGAGIIIPAPSGSGALSSGVSAVVGHGISERVMTGVLVAQNRTMSSTGGVSRTVGTGAILGTEAAAAGVAVGTSRGTGALVTFSALAGAGVSLVEGTGALSSGVAAVAGVAVATQLGSGALTSSSAAVSGAGFVQHVVVSAALAAQAAQVTAGGLSSSTATAPLQASRSTVQGVQGVMIGVGVGDLQAQSRLMAGAGLVRAIGTGSLSVADSFTVNAVGESDSSGSGVLGCSPSIIEATGKGDIEGAGELEPGRAVLASTGGTVRWMGTGELEAQDRKVVGAGRVIATGTGALQLPTVATVTGSGTTSSRGFGNMTSKRATIYGTAFLSTLGSGELQAQNRKVTGVGRVIAFGVGMLRQARPALDGDGLSFSRGTGAIKPRSAQIHAFGVETAYGDGALVSLPVTISGSNLIEGDAVIDAAPAQIVGVGEVGVYIPAMPPDPPGSYPGTTTWAGYTRTPSQLPPPWWMRKAA